MGTWYPNKKGNSMLLEWKYTTAENQLQALCKKNNTRYDPEPQSSKLHQPIHNICNPLLLHHYTDSSSPGLQRTNCRCWFACHRKVVPGNIDANDTSYTSRYCIYE